LCPLLGGMRKGMCQKHSDSKHRENSPNCLLTLIYESPEHFNQIARAGPTIETTARIQTYSIANATWFYSIKCLIPCDPFTRFRVEFTQVA
jgi:hypothetical protein